jgi:hypothetical protein
MKMSPDSGGGVGVRWGRESWEQDVATEAGSGSGVF